MRVKQFTMSLRFQALRIGIRCPYGYPVGLQSPFPGEENSLRCSSLAPYTRRIYNSSYVCRSMPARSSLLRVGLQSPSWLTRRTAKGLSHGFAPAHPAPDRSFYPVRIPIRRAFKTWRVIGFMRRSLKGNGDAGKRGKTRGFSPARKIPSDAPPSLSCPRFESL